MTNTTAELETRIEQTVAEHVAAVRKAAQATVERAFAGAGASVAAPSRPRVARAAGKRRTGTELLALGERFFTVDVLFGAGLAAYPQRRNEADR